MADFLVADQKPVVATMSTMPDVLEDVTQEQLAGRKDPFEVKFEVLIKSGPDPSYRAFGKLRRQIDLRWTKYVPEDRAP